MSSTNANYRTNICTNFYIGCGYNRCGFAHNINELLPRKCGYDGKCINDKCAFYHTGDELDKNSLWNNLLKNHLQYSFENDILNIIKNTIKGFDPKTIEDINNVKLGLNNKSFIVEIDDVESQNNLKEIKIIGSDDIYNDMKNLEDNVANIKLMQPINKDISRYGLDLVCDKDQYLLITNYIKSLNVDYTLGFISK